MTDKAYIVANEEQEREVLEKLEHEGLVWTDDEKFPYVIFENSCVYRDKLEYLQNDEIVYDGREEDQMSDKYVVSQKFMNELYGWKIDYVANSDFLDIDNIGNLPPVVSRWWIYADITDKERNNRLIAIIRWINGEDVFEVEKPKKWVVRSKGTDDDGDYWYVAICARLTNCVFYEKDATKFDTKEEAESWANSHQEVVEVVDV